MLWHHKIYSSKLHVLGTTTWHLKVLPMNEYQSIQWRNINSKEIWTISNIKQRSDPTVNIKQDSLVPAEMTLRKQAKERSNQHSVVFCGNTMKEDSVDYCLDKVCSLVFNIRSKLDCLKSWLDHHYSQSIILSITFNMNPQFTESSVNSFIFVMEEKQYIFLEGTQSRKTLFLLTLMKVIWSEMFGKHYCLIGLMVRWLFLIPNDLFACHQHSMEWLGNHFKI